jgi:hypothetical protein
MTKLSVSCDKCGAVIHLSGETCALDTVAAIDDAVIDLIMDLNAASTDAKGALQKQRNKPQT